MCNETIDKTIDTSSQEQLTTALNNRPCYSAAALMTILAIKGEDIPRDAAEQELLLNNITESQLISFKKILADEIKATQQRCATTDLDIEFLIDSSGSVGGRNWQAAVDSIASDWIEGVIVPLFGPFGNHVAARRFSKLTERFIDFQQQSFETDSIVMDYAG